MEFYYSIIQPIATADEGRSPEIIHQALQDIKALGANAVYQVFPLELTLAEWESYLDAARQEGLSVLAAPGWISKNPDPTDLSPILEILNVVADHPALYGLTYLHEPWEMFTTQQIQAMYQEIKASYPSVRLAVVWSGEIARFNRGKRQFTDGLCDICIINMKAFQVNATKSEEDGLERMRISAGVIQTKDPDAELWSSVQIWAPPGGGKRGFRVPEPAEMMSLFCTIKQSYPLRGFMWAAWKIDKQNQGTLASPELTDQRQAVRDTYDMCVK
jgi:hypothetical protein